MVGHLGMGGGADRQKMGEGKGVWILLDLSTVHTYVESICGVIFTSTKKVIFKGRYLAF